MKITIDTEAKTLEIAEATSQVLPLYSDAAFDLLSKYWVNVGWNQKYAYTFSWMGRPIIQLPEDIIRTQEVIYRLKPTLIVETGVAHGGSLIFYASLIKAMGYAGRVVGVDIEIRKHNRSAIESHMLANYITLIEGGSTDDAIVSQVRSLVGSEDKVLVFLDSNHTQSHVANELEAYHNIVSPGSYIVATDGVMKDLSDAPRGEIGWVDDNPSQAAIEFVKGHPEFEIEQPSWDFNESTLRNNITHWPNAWIKRKLVA